jgi:hypothetical protein
MLIYKSNRVNGRKYVLRQWLLVTLVISIPLIIDILAPSINLINNSFFYYYLPLISLSQLLSLFQKDRINEIVIDTYRQTVSIKYYDVHKGVVRKTFSFKDLKVKILTTQKTLLTDPFNITLFGANKETFEISRSKDGFTTQTMRELVQKLESLTSPVS